jgi:hypothetical protein
MDINIEIYSENILWKNRTTVSHINRKVKSNGYRHDRVEEKELCLYILTTFIMILLYLISLSRCSKEERHSKHTSERKGAIEYKSSDNLTYYRD